KHCHNSTHKDITQNHTARRTAPNSKDKTLVLQFQQVILRRHVELQPVPKPKRYIWIGRQWDGEDIQGKTVSSSEKVGSGGGKSGQVRVVLKDQGLECGKLLVG